MMSPERKRQICISFFAAAAILWQSGPAYAQLWRLNEKLTIRQIDNTQRNPSLLETPLNEVIRTRDLTRAIRDMIRRLKDSMAILKNHRLDRARATELSRISQSNAKDIMRRNKLTQQIQSRSQRSLMQDIRAKNRDLHQRIRDLSRR